MRSLSRAQARRAREWVATEMDVSRNVSVSMFETTIRIIGGLLSAYDLADDPMLLTRARALADKVLINFRVTGHGVLRAHTYSTMWTPPPCSQV